MQNAPIDITQGVIMERIHQILSQIHYKFLINIGGIQWENRVVWPFSGLMAVLADKKMDMGTLTADTVIKILQKNKVRHICEIGAGNTAESVIYPLAEIFRKAGCKMTVIERRISTATISAYESKGISVLHKNAGEINDSSFGADIIIARNVFSIGGQGVGGSLSDDPQETINDIEKAVLDTINCLSTNPSATIILTEGYDILPIDKTVIEKKAKVVAWCEWGSSNAWMYKGERDFPPNVQRIYNQSPNFVILQNLSS